MRIFLDTNILLDILEGRPPFFASSTASLERCQSCGFPIFIAWHSLANCLYIYGRKMGQAQANQALRELLEVVEVAAAGHPEAQRAFQLGFRDTEDALQAVAADACGSDFILTRNGVDFQNSPVAALSPAEFLLKFPADSSDSAR